MALLAAELRVVDHIARDFLQLYGTDYDSSANVQFRSRVGPKSLMRVLLASEARREDFRLAFEERINKGRSGDLRFAVSLDTQRLRKLSRRHLGSGAVLIGVHPVREPSQGDRSATREFLSLHRVFEITQGGLVFIPFDASELS
ncbi:MAG: hypothetical protein HZB75_04685 [Candidatus Saccharibacteria bacterium]|jgi:hypothetical protein|nr:MAG: hypothetical protein HZB75_04685 [Candidatus Saccharibacteria bacterium]